MGRPPARGARVASLAVVVAVVLAVVAPAAAAPGTGPPAGGAASVHADRDGDRVSDDLQAWLSSAPAGAPVDVIATFHDRAGAAAGARGLAERELRRRFQIVPGFAATTTAARVRTWATDPRLRRVEWDGTMRIAMEAARRDFGVDLAHERFGVDGSGTGVCVVDTGVDPAHEQFDSKLPIPFFDAVNGEVNAYDDEGHGTHVASIAVGDGTGGADAARFGGVAPGARLLAAKVLGSTGSGPDSGVIAGIEWCAQRDDVDVISMSLGDPEATSDGLDAVSQAVDNAVTTYNKLVVVAAGNSGDLDGSVTPPGAATLATTVGSVAEWSASPGAAWASGGIHLSLFSGRGPTADGRVKPDLVAPGDSVAAASLGSATGYTVNSGTSMATPFVSGAAALALSQRPDLTPSRVTLLLEATARDRGAPGKDNDWGAGLLDVHALVYAVADVRSFEPGHLFPWEEYLDVTVPDGVTVPIDVEVSEDALGVPIAVTAIIDGDEVCVFPWGNDCLAWEWSPDIDLELLDPTGALVASSACPLQSDVSCGMGRQETLGYRPTTTGTYRLDVIPWGEDPNNGAGGPVGISIQRGPIRHVDVPVPLGREAVPAGPIHVADLDATGEAQGRTWTATVDVALAQSGEAFVGTAIVTGRWAHDGQVGWCVATDGHCRIVRPGLERRQPEVTFTVSDVAAADGSGLVAFDSSAGTDPDGDSDGLRITVSP